MAKKRYLSTEVIGANKTYFSKEVQKKLGIIKYLIVPTKSKGTFLIEKVETLLGLGHKYVVKSVIEPDKFGAAKEFMFVDEVEKYTSYKGLSNF